MIRFTGPIDAAQFLFMLVIVGFLWRLASAKLADHPLGQAMAFIY